MDLKPLCIVFQTILNKLFPHYRPFVEPVNSLKDRFSGSPHIKDNWLDNWQNKWSLRKRNRIVEVQETAEV